MSAVSNMVTPASSAARTTPSARSSSMRMPKLLHPSPTVETSRLPIRRCSTCPPPHPVALRTVAQMAIAPDGSPVPLYLALPGDDEAAVIASAAPAGATVLELGCGAGRVTRPLVARGFRVTGV